jgi:holin-like protein
MKNVVMFLAQIVIICAIYNIARYIVDFLHLPIPSGVFGMILLYFLLSTGLLKVRYIEKAALFLNKHLALFFIPFGVGLMTQEQLIRTSGWQLLLMIAGSAIVGLLVTGGITQYLLKKERSKDEYFNG